MPNDCFQNQLFREKNLSGISIECQTVRTKIRPDVLSGLVWAKTVCKGYQQATPEGEEMKEIGQIGKIEILLNYSKFDHQEESAHTFGKHRRSSIHVLAFIKSLDYEMKDYSKDTCQQTI